MPTSMVILSKRCRAVIGGCAVALALFSLAGTNAAQAQVNAPVHATHAMHITTVAAASQPAASSITAAPAASYGNCPYLPLPGGIAVWRCNGVSWQATACGVGNYEGSNGPYNFWEGVNTCSTRVWIHQYTNYENGHGWAYCLTPVVNSNGTLYAKTYYYDPHLQPANIQVTSVTSPC